MFNCRPACCSASKPTLRFRTTSPRTTIVSTLTGARSEVVETLDYAGTVRGRIGYASGHWLVYATGGFAFAGERFINTPDVGTDQKHINVRPGWAAGAGVEYAFAPHWSVKLEYLYSQFDRANIRFPSGAEHSSTLDFQQVRIGLNRKVDWPGSNSLDPEDRPDRSRIRSLGNPRPEHLSGTGLSGIPRALYRHQQPDARRGRRRRPGATAFI